MRTKKVFVVKNFKSPYIEQAIFILREDTPSEATFPDAVSEAEKIVTGYLAGLDVPIAPPEKKSRAKWMFMTLGLAICFGLICLIIK